MANGIKKIKRLKLLRRIGLVGAIISSFAIIIFLILSFLPKGSSDFTIRIDNPSNSNAVNLVMTTTEDGDEQNKVNYLSAKPIQRAITTKAQDVEYYLKSLESFNKNQNFVEEINGTTYDKALVYTVYLTNKSEDTSKDLRVDYQVNLDGYSNPTNNANLPIDYLRVLVQTQLTDSSDIDNKYYGNKRTAEHMDPERGGYKTDIGTQAGDFDNDQSREPISTYNFDIDQDTGNRMLIRDFQSSGNDGYCINFDAFETGHLVSDVYIEIPAGKTIRFTFVTYFEGVDMDCDGKKPENSNILLSLHFGVQ